jgi:hypothetical protein
MSEYKNGRGLGDLVLQKNYYSISNGAGLSWRWLKK